MSKKDISYSDFLEYIKQGKTQMAEIIGTSEDNLDDLNFYKYDEDALYFLYAVSSQIDVYHISHEDFFSYEDEISLNSYGITFDSIVGGRVKFVLFINPKQDLVSQVANQTKLIPQGDRFTHVVILSLDEKERQEVFNKLNTMSAGSSDLENHDNGLVMLQYTDFKSDPKDIFIKYTKIIGVPYLFDISPYCTKYFTELKKSNNSVNNSVNTFISLVEEIHRDAKGKICTYCGNDGPKSYHLVNLANNILAELYLRFGQKIYTNQRNVEIVAGSIMSGLYNPKTHLFEETYKYYRNLPKCLIQMDSYCIYFNLVKNKNMNIRVRYSDIEDDSENVSQMYLKLNVDDLDIRSIYDYYDIDTLEGCSLLKDKIMLLYKQLGVATGIIDVTKLIIFAKDSKVYIGLIEDLQIEVEVATVTPIGMGNKTLTQDDLLFCYPPDIFLDGPKLAQSILKFNFDPKYCKPHRTGRKCTEFLRTSNLGVTSKYKWNEEWNEVNISTSTIGLFSKYDYLARTGFIKHFINTLGLKETREIVDCFGGFHPRIVDEIDMLINMDINANR